MSLLCGTRLGGTKFCFNAANADDVVGEREKNMAIKKADNRMKRWEEQRWILDAVIGTVGV
ncbi:MAG: hypothetical protein VW547_14940, partial [Alphaproteobacteria bacterium]